MGMNMRQELTRFGRELVGLRSKEIERANQAHIQRWSDPSFQAWVDATLSFQGGIYTPSYTTTMTGMKVEPPADTFLGYAQGAYRTNGVIFAVSMARARPFSEVAFAFRKRGDSGGGPNLNRTHNALRKLERPWPGGTAQQLLIRAEQDVTCGGTFFLADEGDRLRRLRPDWCQFILTAPPDQAVAADIVGVKYTPGGPWGKSDAESRLYLAIGPEPEVAFWSPIPDPDALYRGMSWLSPVIDEFRADKAATQHKLAFFENAATPNLSVSLKENIGPEKFQQFVRMMNDASVGVDKAYKTLYVGGGADVRVVGADMKQLDFAITQGHGETRVAAAGGVPPIVVGLSEGLQSATYSNFGQAKRAYGDIFLRSQWRSFCGAIEPIIAVPQGSILWYDAKDVAFLREDSLDIATRQSTEMGTINTGISAGFDPDTVVKAVMADDWSLLEHTGMVSVQLQDPNATIDPAMDPNAVPEPADEEADQELSDAIDKIGA